MAPKRRGTIYGAPVTTRKRTARRPIHQPSPSLDSSSSSSTPSAVPEPSSPPSPHVDVLAGRMITMGRKVNFGFFDDEGFSIGRLLKEIGWEKVCSLDTPTYPALVKEFYQDLSRGDGGIVSFVRGKRIHLTAEILGNLLEIPTIGPIVSAHSDRSGALSRMLGRDVAEFEEINANQLPLELRLLHNICSRILFPKTGRFEYVSERDIAIMDSVLTGQSINLPGMMIWYMAEAGGKKRSSLPYGMVLTLAFRSQGVVILETEPKKSLRHTDYYSLATLHRMGFSKINGSWVRKGQSEDRTAEVGPTAPSTSHPTPRPSRPASSSIPLPVDVPSASGFSETQLEQLRSLFAIQEAKFDERILNLKESLYSLEDKVNSIIPTLGSSSETFKCELLSIFEKIKDIAGDSDTYSKSNLELQEKIRDASEIVQYHLNEFMRIQKDGMEKILAGLKKLFGGSF